jgi:hypothetical protein
LNARDSEILAAAARRQVYGDPERLASAPSLDKALEADAQVKSVPDRPVPKWHTVDVAAHPGMEFAVTSDSGGFLTIVCRLPGGPWPRGVVPPKSPVKLDSVFPIYNVLSSEDDAMSTDANANANANQAQQPGQAPQQGQAPQPGQQAPAGQQQTGQQAQTGQAPQGQAQAQGQQGQGQAGQLSDAEQQQFAQAAQQLHQAIQSHGQGQAPAGAQANVASDFLSGLVNAARNVTPEQIRAVLTLARLFGVSIPGL